MSVQHIHQKRHRLRKLRGETAYIDATAARLHLASLLGAGWSIRSIAGVSGVAASTLSRFNNGKQAKAAPATIAALLAVKPDALADRTNKASAEPFVSRTGTTRRLQALLFMGWGHRQMREHCGINTACLLHQQGRWVTRSTHDAIAAMYRDLSATRGPSSKAATYATQRGYAGPLAWNDIDHDAEPELETESADDAYDEAAVIRFLSGDHALATNRADRIEIVRRWTASGRPLADLERLGWKPERYRTLDGAA